LHKNFSDLDVDDQQVYLAVLHSMIRDWEHPSSPTGTGLPAVFFLTIQDVDSPDDLLSLLRKEGHAVEVGTKFKFGSGVGLSVEKIEWMDSSHAVVRGGSLFGNVGGAWGPFTLEKREGIWVVVSWKVETVA
jgi:hypothetical protein